jgi:thiosulfate dehydrogenase [quinone] large subunit
MLSGTDAAATLAATRAGERASALPRATPSDGPTARAGGAAGSARRASSPSARTVRGTPVANLSNLQVGDAVAFQAPNGTPAALIRLSRDEVVAYSRVCTHAGCLVGYDASQQVLYCPCHGAEYDPARHAEVLGGPAPRPLQEIPVTIDPATEEVVVPNRS